MMRLRPRLLSLLSQVLPGRSDAEVGWLINEQFIVKEAHSGEAAAFAWHRDSDGVASASYLSVWVPLDDVSEENGTLYIAPRTHVRDADCGGTLPSPPSHASLEDLAVVVSAGAAVVLSSLVLHCSGNNYSDAARRVWMPQIGWFPLRSADGATIGCAVPL